MREQSYAREQPEEDQQHDQQPQEDVNLGGNLGDHFQGRLGDVQDDDPDNAIDEEPNQTENHTCLYNPSKNCCASADARSWIRSKILNIKASNSGSRPSAVTCMVASPWLSRSI